MADPIVVFDLDGTLIDTAPDLLDSLNHSLAIAGLSPVAEDGFRGALGLGSRALIERAFAAIRRAFADGELDALQVAFLQHYAANIPGRSLPYPGVPELLRKLEDGGYALAICTNKLEANARHLIAEVGLAHHFRTITGQDTFDFRKPDPRHLIETIALAGGDPDHALMVGDSRTDIDAAKAAGIPVIALDFGYTDRHVSEFEPSIVVSHHDDITLTLVERLTALRMARRS